MQIDLTPIIGAILSVCAVALTTLGSWALARLAKRLGVQSNNESIQGFDDAMAKAVHAGAMRAQEMIASSSYDHPKVKSAILAFAAPYAVAKFAPALRSIGLDPDDPIATANYLRAELDRIFPTAMTSFATSPVTPALPVFNAASAAQPVTIRALLAGMQ